MPRLDGTGPNGQGPMTGRGFGPCGQGIKRKFGMRGFRCPFMSNKPVSPTDELPALKQEKELLEQDLADIKKEIQDLENEQK